MIIIVDYGVGNLGSIANLIKKIGYRDFAITSDPKLIKKASKIILPGVGSFDNAVLQLNQLGIVDVLKEKVTNEKTPILGICLGMQLMTQSSEEGTLRGLSFIDAKVRKFNANKEYKVPHMGWNTVSISKESKIFLGMTEQENRFYFVHSYYVDCHDQSDILTVTNHGISFTSSFERENIIGVQFHPEKSHKFGMQLIKNFLENF